MKIYDFLEKKKAGEKITMITCYDYTSARIVAQTSVDCVLVGDSVAMTMHGFKDTLNATVDMMCFHIEAVSRGIGNKFIIGDLPFLSYRKSLNKNMEAVQALMQAGAHAVKLENAKGNIPLIKHLVESGIPVMGHLGLSIQAIHALGGYKVQGRTEESKANIMEDALALQDAGCFALVLECVPNQLAQDISKRLQIPTIGIGAGLDTDGQVLVWQDLLGLNVDFKPKFVKTYMQGNEQMHNAIETFIDEVKRGVFPSDQHSYSN